MALLSQIKSAVWSYSTSGGGAIVEGIASLRQCIDLIIRTTKGTDPLRPEFGSDVYKYADAPVDIAIPNIKKAILDAVKIWETRVVITTIKHFIDSKKFNDVVFNIGYKLVDNSINDSLTISIGNGGVITGTTRTGLILQGFFPPNPSGYQYQISCVLNGITILPTPPLNGFATIEDLYLWVQNNWSSFGNWYRNSAAIVGYINPEYTTGTLVISVLQVVKFQGIIPSLDIGDKYSATIIVDGVTYSSDDNLFTADQIRVWAQTVINSLGTWTIETISADFGDDFGDDFNTFTQTLVIYTALATSITITITTEAI